MGFLSVPIVGLCLCPVANPSENLCQLNNIFFCDICDCSIGIDFHWDSQLDTLCMRQVCWFFCGLLLFCNFYLRLSWSSYLRTMPIGTAIITSETGLNKRLRYLTLPYLILHYLTCRYDKPYLTCLAIINNFHLLDVNIFFNLACL